VLDPIDGTFNYSAGIPLCGMLLALVQDGEPIVGLSWLPLLGLRYGATATGPVYSDGNPLPSLARGRLATAMIGYGTLDAARGPVTRAARFGLLDALAGRSARLRMLGSTGVDLALTAAGVLGGAVAFSYLPWDNAAGVVLVRAAGGVVTDVAGKPWTLESDSVLAAAPGIHEELLDLARANDGTGGERE
jgi:myo-inositol-1(or 4)-monophosphatase